LLLRRSISFPRSSVGMPSVTLCVNFLSQVEAIAAAQLVLNKGKAVFFAFFPDRLVPRLPGWRTLGSRVFSLTMPFRVELTLVHAAERPLRHSHGGPWERVCKRRCSRTRNA
jgi:hypothetical protein